MKSPIVIGLIVTLASVIMTWTYVVPILTIIPVTIVEGIVVKFIGKEPYSSVGKSVILILIIAFLLTAIVYFFNEIKREKENHKFRVDLFIGFLLIEFFIIHPLIFYTNWGIKQNFRGDGQLIFGIIDTFPVSSLAFVFLGLITEVVRIKGKQRVSNNKKAATKVTDS